MHLFLEKALRGSEPAVQQLRRRIVNRLIYLSGASALALIMGGGGHGVAQDRGCRLGDKTYSRTYVDQNGVGQIDEFTQPAVICSGEVSGPYTAYGPGGYVHLPANVYALVVNLDQGFSPPQGGTGNLTAFDFHSLAGVTPSTVIDADITGDIGAGSESFASAISSGGTKAAFRLRYRGNIRGNFEWLRGINLESSHPVFRDLYGRERPAIDYDGAGTIDLSSGFDTIAGQAGGGLQEGIRIKTVVANPTVGAIRFKHVGDIYADKAVDIAASTGVSANESRIGSTLFDMQGDLISTFRAISLSVTSQQKPVQRYGGLSFRFAGDAYLDRTNTETLRVDLRNMVKDGGGFAGRAVLTLAGDNDAHSDEQKQIEALATRGGYVESQHAARQTSLIRNARGVAFRIQGNGHSTVNIEGDVTLEGADVSRRGEERGGSFSSAEGDEHFRLKSNGTLTTTAKMTFGAGTNEFTTETGSLFSIGGDIFLGGGNVFSNFGTLSAGGAGRVHAVTIQADEFRHMDGTLLVDIEGDKADLITIDGRAVFAGRVLVTDTSTPVLDRVYTILETANAGDLDYQSGSVSVQDTLEFVFDIALRDNQYVEITAGRGEPGAGSDEGDTGNSGRGEVRFASRAACAGQSSLTSALEDIKDLELSEEGIGPYDAFLVNLWGLQGNDGRYAAALKQLSPRIHLDAQISAGLGAQAFTEGLTARVTGASWANYEVQGFKRGGKACSAGVKAERLQMMMGHTYDLGPALQGSLGLGFQRHNLNGEVLALSQTIGGGAMAKADLDSVQVGGALHYEFGAAAMDLQASFTRNQVTASRIVSVPDHRGVSGSDYAVDVGQLGLAARYEAALSPGLTLTPSIRADLQKLDRARVRERGGDEIDLVLHNQTNTTHTVTPQLHAALTHRTDKGLVLQPYLSAGGRWSDRELNFVNAAFSGVPGGRAEFSTLSAQEEWTGLAEVGFHLRTENYSDVHLYYSGEYAGAFDTHAVGIKASTRF